MISLLGRELDCTVCHQDTHVPSPNLRRLGPPDACDLRVIDRPAVGPHQRREPPVAVAANNVRVGSTTDLQRHSHLRLLSGVKQTSNVCYSESPALMSAFGGKADIQCPLFES